MSLDGGGKDGDAGKGLTAEGSLLVAGVGGDIKGLGIHQAGVGRGAGFHVLSSRPRLCEMAGLDAAGSLG